MPHKTIRLSYEIQCSECGTVLTPGGLTGREACGCSNNAYIEVLTGTITGGAVRPEKLLFRNTGSESWLEYTSFFETNGRVKSKAVPSTMYEEPPRYDQLQVKTLRTSMGLSQPAFASLTGASLGTIQAWEQGKASPSGCAARLLQVLQLQGEVFEKTVPVKAS